MSLSVGATATLDSVKHELHKLQLFYEDAIRLRQAQSLPPPTPTSTAIGEQSSLSTTTVPTTTSTNSSITDDALSVKSEFSQDSMNMPTMLNKQDELIKQQIHTTIHAIADRMDTIRNYELMLHVKIKEMLQFERKAKYIARMQFADHRIILNVGGKLFETTIDTLLASPNYALESRSYFAVMLSQLTRAYMAKHEEATNKTNTTTALVEKVEPMVFFIDRNPEFFSIILDHLRGVNVRDTITHLCRDLDACNKLQAEVEFYRISSMYHYFPELIKRHCSNRYLLATHNSLISMWDLVENRVAATFSGHKDDIYCMTQLYASTRADELEDYIPSKLFASGGFDKTVRIWNRDTHEQLQSIHFHEGVTVLESLNKFHKQHYHQQEHDQQQQDKHKERGMSFAVGTELGNVYLFKQSKSETTTFFEQYNVLTTAHCGDVAAMAMINAYLLACAGKDGHTRIWNVDTGDLVQTLVGHFDAVTCLAVIHQPVGKILHETDDQHHHQQDNEEDSMQRASTVESRQQAASDTNELNKCQQAVIVTGSADKTIRMWDIESGSCIYSIITPSIIESMCYIQNMHMIATGHDSGAIHLWNLSNMKHVSTLHGHYGWVYAMVSASLSGYHNTRREPITEEKESTHLISSAHDGTIRIWNVATRECVNVLTAIPRIANARTLQFSDSETSNQVIGEEKTSVPVWSLCML